MTFRELDRTEDKCFDTLYVDKWQLFVSISMLINSAEPGSHLRLGGLSLHRGLVTGRDPKLNSLLWQHNAGIYGDLSFGHVTLSLLDLFIVTKNILRESEAGG